MVHDAEGDALVVREDGIDVDAGVVVVVADRQRVSVRTPPALQQSRASRDDRQRERGHEEEGTVQCDAFHPSESAATVRR